MKSKHSMSERFNYWFDNRMAKGGIGLIKILAIASAFVVLIVSVAIVISQNLTGGVRFRLNNLGQHDDNYQCVDAVF